MMVIGIIFLPLSGISLRFMGDKILSHPFLHFKFSAVGYVIKDVKNIILSPGTIYKAFFRP